MDGGFGFCDVFSGDRRAARAPHGPIDRADRGIAPTRRTPLRSTLFSSIIPPSCDRERPRGNRSGLRGRENPEDATGRAMTTFNTFGCMMSWDRSEDEAAD